MTDPVATLTVDGEPHTFNTSSGEFIVVRIDGNLPTVAEHKPPPHEPWCGDCYRPLRVGDRVWLATDECEFCHAHGDSHMFATATVAATDYHRRYPDNYWLVTVTDVEALS